MTEEAAAESKATSQEELAKQFEQLRADVAEISRLLKDIGLEKAEGLREDVKGRAEDMSQTAAKLEAEIAAHVREKPLQTLAIVGLVGFVLGLLSRRG